MKGKNEKRRGEGDSGEEMPRMRFHHVGVAVKSIEAALPTYLELFGCKRVGQTVEVPSQQVKVCFVEADGGVLIELVEGVGEGSPVEHVLKQPGAGPYHLCYRTADIDLTVKRLRSKRCFLLKTFEQEVEGRLHRFAFMLSPERQLFELCELAGEGDRIGP
jgi:methylmalonyl-CoA/ethylmalonyl-CoA epimerase